MNSRMFMAAGFAAVVVIALMVAPFEADARATGFGRSMAPQRSFHPPAARPFVHRPSHIASRGARLHGPSPLRHRGFNGFGWPLAWWGGAGWYGTYYDPSNYVLLHDQPIYSNPMTYPLPQTAPAPERVVHVIVYRPGCDTEMQKVSWGDGSERSIAVVRC